MPKANRGWSKSSVGVAVIAGFFVCQPAHAFKMTTHVASANLTEDKLATMVAASGTGTLVFIVKGQRLEIPVAVGDAYQAVMRHPDFFRAGVIGPDGFPDLITGQMVHHGNESPSLKSWTHSAASELNPPTHNTTDPYESREGPAELRAVDFAMALLDFANSGAYAFDGPSSEHEKVLGYIMGYFSHGVGDGFGHAWINEIAGGAWDLGRGGGMWGPASEEVRHVAIETLVDSRVPSNLVSSPGSSQLDRVAMTAPSRFLDAFYASPTPHAQAFGNKSGDIVDFVSYYRNLDRFFGGPFYNYFNLQADTPDALENFSQAKPLFDLAQKHQLTGFENTLLDVANIPGEIVADITSWFGVPARGAQTKSSRLERPIPQQTGNACTAARAAAHRLRLFDGLGRARARRDAVALGLLSQRSAWSTFVPNLSGRATCHQRGIPFNRALGSDLGWQSRRSWR
jgi:hypothetical protein